MATVIEFQPAHAGNGRFKPSDPSPEYQGLGFRFVQRFLLLILLTVGLLTALAGVLGGVLGMDVIVEGTGGVEPTARRQVKAELAGLIKAVHVDQWQRVNEGDPLITLEDAEWRTELLKISREITVNASRRAEIETQIGHEREVLRAEVARARSEEESFSLQLEQAEKEYRLYYGLYPWLPDGSPRPPVENLLPIRLRRAMLRRTEADLNRAERRLEALEGRRQEIRTLERMGEKLAEDRDLLRHRLEQTVMCAPVSGTVLTGELRRRVGDRLQAGESVLEISDLSGWEAKVMVQEMDIPKVKPGQPVRLYLHAFPHLEYKIFEGTVEEAPARPAPDPPQAGDPLYPVRVSIRNPDVSDGEKDYSLACGMRLDARIVVDRGRIASLLWRKLLRAAGKSGRHDLHLPKVEG